MNERPVPPDNAKLPLDARMLDGLLDPVFLVDSTHVIVDYNLAAKELLGADALGSKFNEKLDSRRIMDAIDARLGGTPATRSEVFLPYPIARDYELNVWRLPDLKSPGPAWAMVVLHDVTAVKKAAQMRVDFVSNVSHELRSPLSSLAGFIETLQGPAKDDPEARERFLAIMEAEAKRMTRLISDLLTLSKVESGEHIRPEGHVNLHRVLNQVAAAASVRAEGRNMTVKVECGEDLPDVIGDGDELNQVFGNLIDNAINYGRTKTPVRVTVQAVDSIPETNGPGIAVAVENQGEGIPPKHLARLTERFYRVDKGRSRNMGGTGLGLAIVKHIVVRHRGHLAISSTPGGRVVFTVYLPRANVKID